MHGPRSCNRLRQRYERENTDRVQDIIKDAEDKAFRERELDIKEIDAMTPDAVMGIVKVLIF